MNWHVLPASNEVIWFSERDNWGQLYLYDLTTGQLKHQITTGEGNVTQLVRIDEKTRTLYFIGVGKETGRDPYFRHLYKIGMDGKGLTLLTPEDADHDVDAVADRASIFVDTYSTPDAPPTTVRARSRTASCSCRSRRPTSRSSSPRAGSRPCRSR